jgi:ATP-dependent DNA ligase
MQIPKQVRLLFNDWKVGGRSNKEYSLPILFAGGCGAVAAQYGRRGAALTRGYLTPGGGWSKTAVSRAPELAETVYRIKLTEKVRGGYAVDSESAANAPPPQVTEASLVSSGVESAGAPPCELLAEIDEATALRLIESEHYWLQRKLDGQRRMIRKSAGRIVGINRKGRIVPIPPELEAEAKRLPLSCFLMDGEAIGEQFIVFDLLEADEPDFRSRMYWQRFSDLLGILSPAERQNGGLRYIRPVETWFKPEPKRQGLKWLHEMRAEGAVLKRLEAPFRPGRNGQHFKNKFVKSCTCKVIAKDRKDAAQGQKSVALGLLNAKGEWVEVGHASAIGKTFLPPDPLGVLAEVSYLYATEARRLYQARLTGLRTDVRESDCTMSQLIFKADVNL